MHEPVVCIVEMYHERWNIRNMLGSITWTMLNIMSVLLVQMLLVQKLEQQVACTGRIQRRQKMASRCTSIPEMSATADQPNLPG